MFNIFPRYYRLELGVLLLGVVSILIPSLLINNNPAFVHAETNQSPIPTAIPDPAIVTLQTQVYAQATQVANLEQQVDNQIGELRVEVREKYLPWTIVAAVLAILGVPATVWGVSKYAREKIKKQIDQAIYGVDPVNVTIRVPQSDFDHEKQHLERLGFYKIHPYQVLDNTCLEGCVVVVVRSEQDITDFRAFVREYSPNPKKVAYLLYTTKLRVPEDIVDDFSNITFSNTILTLGTNLFTIARSLIHTRDEK